jgi:hypothetical protein
VRVPMQQRVNQAAIAQIRDIKAVAVAKRERDL